MTFCSLARYLNTQVLLIGSEIRRENHLKSIKPCKKWDKLPFPELDFSPDFWTNQQYNSGNFSSMGIFFGYLVFKYPKGLKKWRKNTSFFLKKISIVFLFFLIISSMKLWLDFGGCFFSLTLPSKKCTQHHHKVSFKHARSSMEIFGSKLTDDWKLGVWPGFDKHLGLSSRKMEISSWKTIRRYQFSLSQLDKWGIFQGSMSFGGVKR